jgi:hypothetical protein
MAVLILVLTILALQLILAYMSRGAKATILGLVVGLIMSTILVVALIIDTPLAVVSAAILFVGGLVPVYLYSSKYGKPTQKQ